MLQLMFINKDNLSSFCSKIGNCLTWKVAISTRNCSPGWVFSPNCAQYSCCKYPNNAYSVSFYVAGSGANRSITLPIKELTLLHATIFDAWIPSSIHSTSFYKIMNWTGTESVLFSFIIAASRVGVKWSESIIIGSICFMYSIVLLLFLFM